jgi:signal transduction histidine kinase
VDPESIVEASAALFTTQADAVGIHLETSSAPDLPLIHADTERLLQVTFNLLGNAMKFTGRDGTVALSASRDDAANAVRFRISDTGSGIPGEHLPHLFDRYWQLHRTHRGGAGLGLAIAKGIVHAHGGTIGVTSIEGEGSTFDFTIPAVPPKTRESRREAPA